MENWVQHRVRLNLSNTVFQVMVLPSYAFEISDEGQTLGRYADAALADTVVFPAFRGEDRERGHWTLLVTYPWENRLVNYDSAGGDVGMCYQAMSVATFLTRDSDLDWVATEGEVAHQRNGVDCGIFVMEVARAIISGTPLAIDPLAIDAARYKIMRELLTGIARS